MAWYTKIPLFIRISTLFLAIEAAAGYLHAINTPYYWPAFVTLLVAGILTLYKWLHPIEIITQAMERYGKGEHAALYQLPDSTSGEITSLVNEFKTIVKQSTEDQTRLESVLNTVSTAIATITEQGEVKNFNESAQRIFGYSADEVIGKNIKMLMPSEHKHQHDGYLRKYKETGNASIIGKGRELIGVRKNGEEFPLHLHIGQIDLEEGRVFTGVMEDLSKLKSSEQAEKETRHQLEQEAINAANQKARLESIVNTVGTAIITISDKGIIERFNEAAQRIFGYSDSEVFGKNIKALMPDEHKYQHDGYLAKFNETGKASIIGTGRELIGIRKNGEHFPMHLHVGQLKVGDDIVFTGAIEDRSDLKKAQMSQQEIRDSLEQEKKRLEKQDWVKTSLARMIEILQREINIKGFSKTLLDNLIPLMNSQLGVFYFSEKSETNEKRLKRYGTYGYSSDQSLRPHFAWNEGLVGECARSMRPIYLTDVPANYIHRIGSALGDTPPRQVIIFPLQYEGETLAIVEIASLTEFSAQHRELLQRAADLCGIMINSIITRLQTETLLARTQEQAEQLQSNEEELKATNEQLASQGAEVEERNRQLEETQAELEETSQYKSEFLANMSHELRTPLNSLLILAKMLADNKDDNLSDHQVTWASTVYQSGNDLLHLINDILDLSKIEAGQMQLNVQTMVFDQFIDAIEKSFAPTAQEKDIEFVITLHDTLPKSMVTDEQRLTQILRNFLSNAFKFTKAGTVSLDIRHAENVDFLQSTALKTEGALAFSVTDSGIGIREEKQAFIFQAFQQLDSSIQREYGGTGLGLSISRQLANLLQGEIHLQSIPDKGSTFTLYLPVTVDASSPGTTPPGAILPVPAHKNDRVKMTVPDDREDLKTDRQTVLLIEDDPKFALLVAELVHENHYNILISNNGAEGYLLAKEFQPSGIILDLVLAGLSGQSTLARLKDDATTRHIPVHVVSGTSSIEEVKCQGVIGFLQKPVSQTQLVSVLERFKTLKKRSIQQLLLVEDDPVQAGSIKELLGNHDMQVTLVDTAKSARSQLQDNEFDCMVLDLKLPDMNGLELLQQLTKDSVLNELPIIVYTAKDLSNKEQQELNKYAKVIIQKSEKGAEKLLDEVVLFLHRVEVNLPDKQRNILQKIHNVEAILDAKTVLLVDDDMRNIYAVSAALEEKNMEIVIARNGSEALDQLAANDNIHIVLMDIMMPEMDGYEAMRRIRQQLKYKDLPIIALTAKAMAGDRERCIETGANDYISKPIEMERLLSLMRVWLY